MSVNRIRSLRPPTVFVDVCPRDTHTPHGLSCFVRGRLLTATCTAGQCLHFECRGAPARVRVWRCEGRPPLPHCVCGEIYLTLP